MNGSCQSHDGDFETALLSGAPPDCRYVHAGCADMHMPLHHDNSLCGHVLWRECVHGWPSESFIACYCSAELLVMTHVVLHQGDQHGALGLGRFKHVVTFTSD